MSPRCTLTQFLLGALLCVWHVAAPGLFVLTVDPLNYGICTENWKVFTMYSSVDANCVLTPALSVLVWAVALLGQEILEFGSIDKNEGPGWEVGKIGEHVGSQRWALYLLWMRHRYNTYRANHGNSAIWMDPKRTPLLAASALFLNDCRLLCWALVSISLPNAEKKLECSVNAEDCRWTDCI